MKIIECTHLTKEYLSGDNVVKAVDDITISFEQGEICAITGPSGSGKSTFLLHAQQFGISNIRLCNLWRKKSFRIIMIISFLF